MAKTTLTGACLCQAITYRMELPENEPTPKVRELILPPGTS